MFWRSYKQLAVMHSTKLSERNRDIHLLQLVQLAFACLLTNAVLAKYHMTKRRQLIGYRHYVIQRPLR